MGATTALAVFLFAGTFACTSEPTHAGPTPRTEAVSVIDGGRWQAIPRAEDPFAAAMPDAVTDCIVPGVLIEDDVLEMDTGLCDFISAETPLTEPIHKGERVQLTFWHLALYADPPAKGQFALRIDGDPVWQLEVDIPKLEQVYRPAWIASRAYPAGARVQVHVHNHGANTWKLFDLTAGGSGD